MHFFDYATFFTTLLHSQDFWVKAIIPFFAGVIIKLIAGFFTKHPRVQKESYADERKISQMMRDLKHQTYASVAFILTYHNNKWRHDNKPMLKLTMEYPKDSEHIQLAENLYNDIPVSTFGDMVMFLYQYGEISQDEIITANNTKDKPELTDHKYRSMMAALGMQSHYAKAVYVYKWKVDAIFNWRKPWFILFPFRKDKVMIASVHWGSHEPISKLLLCENKMQCKACKDRQVACKVDAMKNEGNLMSYQVIQQIKRK